MKKRLFSGTSLWNYERVVNLNKSFFTDDITIALGFAIKRARQDNSIGIIIEIINIKDFEVEKETRYTYRVSGKLLKENHKIYMRNDLNKLSKLFLKYYPMFKKFNFKEIYEDRPDILSLLGFN